MTNFVKKVKVIFTRKTFGRAFKQIGSIFPPLPSKRESLSEEELMKEVAANLNEAYYEIAVAVENVKKKYPERFNENLPKK